MSVKSDYFLDARYLQHLSSDKIKIVIREAKYMADSYFIKILEKNESEFIGIIIKDINKAFKRIYDRVSLPQSSMTLIIDDIYRIHKDHFNKRLIVKNLDVCKDSTCEIDNKAVYTDPRTKSFVYENMDKINNVDTFIKMRILEFEDNKNYSLEKTNALNYVFKLITNHRYNFGPKAACKEATRKYEKFGLTFKEIDSGNRARMNIRRTCKRLWKEKYGEHS